MNVGSSKKRNSNNRGFRGIGRLGGMSYCDNLIFTTSAENENVKTVVSFDCKRLRRLLVPGEYEDMSLSAVLEEITTITTFPEKEEKHYLCVEMIDVNGFSDLLDIEAAKSYISQVAPLPYQSRHFLYTSQLKSFLSDNGYTVEEFPIFVGENESDLEPVYKPNKSRFRADRGKRTADEITNMIRRNKPKETEISVSAGPQPETSNDAVNDVPRPVVPQMKKSDFLAKKLSHG